MAIEYGPVQGKFELHTSLRYHMQASPIFPSGEC